MQSVFETSLETLKRQAREWGGARVPPRADVADAADDIRRHFRENCPILLDGALPLHADAGHFVREARESLARGRADPARLPAAILREALDAVRAVPRPDTRAGLVAVNPRRARVWWDADLLDDVGDVLADLEKPRPTLRFYDVTGLDPDAGRWNDSFDIDVALAERGKTVDFWAADRTYVVELGLVHADGRFLRLARTNTADLPREGRGSAADSGLARSNLRPRARRAAALAVDAAARDWAESRHDHPARDWDAELLMHMLYRAFLDEGPRSLRRAARPYPKDVDARREEFSRRKRQRQRRVAALAKPAMPSVLAMRLDSTRPAPIVDSPYLPAPLAGIASPAALADLSAERFALYRGAVRSARFGETPTADGRAAASLPEAEAGRIHERADELVRALPDAGGTALPDSLASPVFEAARSLQRRLAETPAPSADSAEAAAGHPAPKRKKPESFREFGGAESRRFARAGVRFTRMAMTLEGKMRPGARLKVAGKLVYADADGNFRLECVLSGRRASIPMRAGTSIGGEARGVITVDWEKLPSREKSAAAEEAR